jgi:hypothetical protein
MPIIEGGTNATTMATTDGVVYYDGTRLVTTAVGTATQVLTSNGAGVAPTFQAAGGGGGGVTTITGDSGGALTGSNITFTGASTGLTFSGASTTETLTGTLVVANGGTGRATLTNHGILVGATTTAITQVAPSATAGIPFVSAGASADPAYGTAVVAGGGTGDTSFTAYSVVCGGTTSTGALQNVSGVGTSGQVLTSNGAAALPTWQAGGGGGGGITTIATPSGSATGSTVTFNTVASSQLLSGGFSATGSTVTLTFQDSVDNIFIGNGAGKTGSPSQDNVGIGNAALNSIDPASDGSNVAIGFNALAILTTGNSNVAIGELAGGDGSSGGVVTGSNNIYIGSLTGISADTADSSNIYLNNNVAGSESHKLRIGNATGTGDQELNAAFVCGITGITVTGTPVLISTSNQLGIAVSSAQFKHDIKDMGDDSSKILQLKPVTFLWDKSSAPGLADATDERQYGLIAEEVAEVMPDLVTYQDGKPLTVKYADLPAILLNEIQKLHKRIEALEAR